MSRGRVAQLASLALIGVVGILWIWRPQRPLALRVAVDVIGVVMAIGWLIIITGWLRNTVGWVRWARTGGLRTIGAGVSARSSAPLFAALAALAAIAFVISQIA